MTAPHPKSVTRAAGQVIPSPVASDAIDEAIVVFQTALRNVVQDADEVLAEVSMGRTHHKILFYAARHWRCPVSEIRDFIGVSRQGLQRPLNDLHRAGLVQTLVSPENRRVHQLVLTAEGLALEKRTSALVRAHFELAFGKVGEKDRLQWLAVMQALSGS